MNKTYTHGFIGCGKMAQILLHSLLQNRRASARQIITSRRHLQDLKKIQRRFRVSTTQKNPELARHSQILWLGIKPFQAQEVLKEIAPHLRPNTIIVSMMAGVSTQMIRRYLGARRAVLRIMPNTPALLGQGVTGAYFTPGFPRAMQNKLIRLLQDLGEVVVLKNEGQFDAVTGLSGSGPAFIYSVARGLIAGGKAAGLAPEQARVLTVQTLVGAAAMLKETEEDPATLIAQVVSKGGTTEAGLKILKKIQMENGMRRTVLEAAKRSKVIGSKLK